MVIPRFVSLLIAFSAAAHAQFTPAPGSPFPVGVFPLSVAVGDFNGDGKAGRRHRKIREPDNVSVLLGDGTGGFTPAPGSPITVGYAVAVAVDDFNGDGKLDLATTNGMVLLGDGTGKFTPAPGSPFPVGADPVSVAVGDFNGDGKPDLAIASSGGNNVTVLLGDGTGGFTAASGSPITVGLDPSSVAVGDFNGDGRLDLTIANSSDNTITVLLGDGTGRFMSASGSPIAVGLDPSSVAVGEFNGDGKPDLAIGNVLDGTVTVPLGNGMGGFGGGLGQPVYGAGRMLSPWPCSGFLNGDGKLDLVIANGTVLLGNGTGGFAPALGSPFPVGSYSVSVAVGDFNEDGKPDLVTANELPNTVTVLLNITPNANLNWHFTPAPGSPFSVVPELGPMATADLNDDGKLDIAAVSGDNSITVLLGNGAGGFTPAPGSPFPVGLSPSSVAVGDFNGDGKPDLAVASYGYSTGTVTVLLGNGTGGFTAASDSPFPVGLYPSSVAVGDFNDDGKQDLVIVNSSDNNVSVLLG